MKKSTIVLLVGGLGYLCPQPLLSQSSYYQVSVYFTSGVTRIISPGDTAASVTAQDILNVLSKYGLTASSVYPAFPAFNEADTVIVIDKLGDKIKQMDKAKVFTITVSDTTTQNKLISDLKGLSEVLFAEENGNNKPYIVPNDPYFGNQWGLNNTTNPGDDIHAESAWNIFTGNPASVIGIVDYGVDITHQDLKSKIIGGDNSYSTEGSGSGQFSHGTLVAGIAAASTNNGVGIAGVDWNARMVPTDITDYWNCVCLNYRNRQHGDVLISSKIYQAVNSSSSAWTLNHSYGLTFKSGLDGRYSTLVREAFAFAYKNNRLSCAAVGNALPGSNVFPAGFNTGMLAVGGSDNADNPFASTVAPFVDVVAPAYNIYSTNFNNQYTSQQGSSLSTAFVTGLASLLKGFNTSLSNDDIINIIEKSADYKGSTPPYDEALGYGRINAQRALQYLQSPYQLQTLTATGGTVYASSGNIIMGMLGVLTLADAFYIVQRKEVRTTINLPTNLCSMVGVWGTGLGTTGYHDDGGNCYGEGFCQVVPGSVTSTQATLRTYVYYVTTILGQTIGYVPTSPQNVKFAYSILGIPEPAINGDALVCTTTSNPYTLSNLPTNSSVNWTASPTGVVTVNTPSANSTTLTKLASDPIILSAAVTNGCGLGQNFTATKSINIGGPPVTLSGSPTGSCSGTTQTWSLGVSPTSNGSNWDWTVGYLGNNSSIYIHNPTFPNTLVDVVGGGTVNLSYTDLCGVAQKNGITVYSSCHAAAVISPNPSSGTLMVSTNSSATQASAPSTSSSVTTVWKIYAINVLSQAGNLLKSYSYPGGVVTTNLDLSGLPNGAYTLQLFDNIIWTSQQFIVLK
jgi:hypothetical protein